MRGEPMDLVEFDWLVTSSWRVLHHAALTPEQQGDMENNGNAESVVLTCGRRASVVMIPGVMSRMGLPRCGTCCKRRGMPEGKGSPKNDLACRKVLRRQGYIGLDSPEQVDLRDRVANWRETPKAMKDERWRRRNARLLA